MATSANDFQGAQATDVRVTDDELTVTLVDGRTLSVPLVWYPRLLRGNERERKSWRLIGGGAGIHWPELDEDVSVDGLLAGRRSRETQRSLERWMKKRASSRVRKGKQPAVRRTRRS